MTTPEKSLLRTVRSTLLIAGGRFIGILWPILITNDLGIAFYGRFAIVIAVSALITIPMDAYYLVRSPRTSDEDFVRDQSSRVWTGLLLVGGGIFTWVFASIVGFSITKAGFDMIFNARKSSAFRYSRPDRALTEDAIRQALSLATFIAVLSLVDGHTHTMTVVGVCYLVGYLPFAIAVIHTVAGVKPRLPVRSKTTGFLTLEAIVGVLYLQGDIIVLGWLISDAQIGYYSISSQVAQTAGQIGQSYCATYHDRLREHDGAASAGPRLKHIYLGAGVCAGGMVLGALALLVGGGPTDLWLTFLLCAMVAATRFCSAVFTTVLALQSRDLYRLRLSFVALAAKMIAIVALAQLASPGAAIAFLIGEAILVLAARHTIYADRTALAATP